MLKERLDLFSGPPSDYIPGCYVDNSTNGPVLFKYKSLLEPEYTPFLYVLGAGLAVYPNYPFRNDLNEWDEMSIVMESELRQLLVDWAVDGEL